MNRSFASLFVINKINLSNRLNEKAKTVVQYRGATSMLFTHPFFDFIKKSKITFELKSPISFSFSSLFACLIQVVSGDSVTLTCLNSSWLCLNRCPSTCQHSPMNNVAFGWRNGKWRRPKRRQPFAMTTTSSLTITDTCGSEVLVGSPPTPARSVRFWRKKQLIGWLTCTTAYYQVTICRNFVCTNWTQVHIFEIVPSQ